MSVEDSQVARLMGILLHVVTVPSEQTGDFIFHPCLVATTQLIGIEDHSPKGICPARVTIGGTVDLDQIEQSG